MSDKDRQPWSVRGVTGEARARAARAAHRRRMTIGEWVTETILRAAARDLGETAEAPAPQAGLPAVRPQAEGQLAGALGTLVRHLETARGGSIAEVTRRVERTEAVLTGRMEQIAAGLYAVMQSIERNAMAPIAHQDPREAAVAAEQARLAEQVARLAAQEHRRQDQMAAIAEALTLLAGKVETRPAPQPAAAPAPPEPAPVAPAEAPPPAPAVTPETPPAPSTFASGPAVPRHHDPRAEAVAAEIRAAAKRPPEILEPEEETGRRRGLLGRLLRRD